MHRGNSGHVVLYVHNIKQIRSKNLKRHYSVDNHNLIVHNSIMYYRIFGSSYGTDYIICGCGGYRPTDNIRIQQRGKAQIVGKLKNNKRQSCSSKIFFQHQHRRSCRTSGHNPLLLSTSPTAYFRRRARQTTCARNGSALHVGASAPNGGHEPIVRLVRLPHVLVLSDIRVPVHAGHDRLGAVVRRVRLPGRVRQHRLRVHGRSGVHMYLHRDRHPERGVPAQTSRHRHGHPATDRGHSVSAGAAGGRASAVFVARADGERTHSAAAVRAVDGRTRGRGR